MPLYYDKTIRARLLACLDPDQPDIKFRSENERSNLIESDKRQIYAEVVTAENPWSDHEGNPIDPGDYAITRSDGKVFRSANAFFESVYAPYLDFSEPTSSADRYDIVA